MPESILTKFGSEICHLIKKEILEKVFSCKISETFENTYLQNNSGLLLLYFPNLWEFSKSSFKEMLALGMKGQTFFNVNHGRDDISYINHCLKKLPANKTPTFSFTRKCHKWLELSHFTAFPLEIFHISNFCKKVGLQFSSWFFS